MVKHVAIALGLLIVVPACSKDKKADGEGGACPALSVTVDGKPVEGLGFGLAATIEDGGKTMQQVVVFNRERPCDELTTGTQTYEDNDIFARAFSGDLEGVGFDAHTQMTGKVTIDKAPGKVGEVVELCVRQPNEFTPGLGTYENKKVSIVGLFSGKYCGVQAIK